MTAGPRGEPAGSARLGRERLVGLAVRLPRAWSIPRLPRALVCQLPRHRCTCGSSRTSIAGTSTAGDLYAPVGVDPGFVPPARRATGQRRATECRLRWTTDWYDVCAATSGRATSPRRAPPQTACPGRVELTRTRYGIRCPTADIPFNRASVEGRSSSTSGRRSTAGTCRRPDRSRSARSRCCSSGAVPRRCCSPRRARRPSSCRPDARPAAGRHGGRAVVHVHDDRLGVRPAGRAAAVLRHRAGDPRSRRGTIWRRLLDDTVRAVVPVHYAGVACDVDGIRKALAGRPDVAVIEDNAHGLFGRWNDQPLGSLGRFSTLSFHETKNINCGEGGALVLNDASRRRPGTGALRQGHQPPSLLPRPGRQVLLEGHRLVLRALGHARGVPVRPAGEGRGHPGQASERLRAL